MPIQKQYYPDNWDEISLQIREEAGQMCEWCGARNKKVIRRIKQVIEKELHIGCSMRTRMYMVDWELVVGEVSAPGSCILERVAEMPWHRLRFHRLTRVVLTVAHLDRNPGNNDRSNLAALCQRCHFRHDVRQHVASRRYGRDHAKEQQGRLFEEDIIH